MLKHVKIHPILRKVLDIEEYINATTILINKNDINFEGDGPYIVELNPEKCKRCSGSGYTLYGSLENSVFTQDDFNEDPDLLTDLKSGKYNVACSDCNGQGVVLNIKKNNNNNIIKTITKLINEEMDYNELCKKEREMGC